MVSKRSGSVLSTPEPARGDGSDGAIGFVVLYVVVAEDRRLVEDYKQELDALQRRVSELQAEYKEELRKSRDLSEVCYIHRQ